MTGKFLIPSNILIIKLDDHRILVKFLKVFDQNSGGQPFRWLWNYLLKIPVWKALTWFLKELMNIATEMVTYITSADCLLF